MGDKTENAEMKAVQLDRESQEYGSQHGQDTLGQETGSSSPTTLTDDQSSIQEMPDGENK